MKTIKNILIGVGVVISLFAVVFALNAWGLFNLDFWGTKYRNAHYHIFKNSQSYQQGMIQDLQNMRMKYYDSSTTDEEKEAIRDTVLQRYGSFPTDQLPSDLRNFYFTLREAK